MIVWMRRNARGLQRGARGQRRRRARARARCSALVAMAFFAVIREGFETSVFLLAAFDASSDRSRPAAARCSASLLAVAIGYGHLPRRREDQPGAVLPGHRPRARAGRRRASSRPPCTPRTRPAGSTACRAQAVDLAWLVAPGTVRSVAPDRHARLPAAPTVTPRSPVYLALRDPDGDLRPLAVAAPAALRPPSPAGVAAAARRAHGMTARIALPARGCSARRRLRGAGCGSGGDAAEGAPASAPSTVKLTDAGCEPAELRARRRARPPSRSTNDGAATRHRVRDARRRPHPRRGRERRRRPHRAVLADARSPGDYTMYCPGGTSAERGTLDRHRRGHRRRERGRGRRGRTATASYVEEQTALLVTATPPFVAAVQAGDIEGARRCTRRRASPTSGSSRSPRASATSIPRSTPATATSRRRSGRASTRSSRRSGSRHDRGTADARRRS